MKIYLCPYENRGLKLPVNISTKSPFRIFLASILVLCPAPFSALVTERCCETERDTVTGKVRNAKDKKKSIFQRHKQMYQLNYPFFAEWTRYMDWNIFSFF
jgi:hypothetical protein